VTEMRVEHRFGHPHRRVARAFCCALPPTDYVSTQPHRSDGPLYRDSTVRSGSRVCENSGSGFCVCQFLPRRSDFARVFVSKSSASSPTRRSS
jgi:hypothetical protein